MRSRRMRQLSRRCCREIVSQVSERRGELANFILQCFEALISGAAVLFKILCSFSIIKRREMEVFTKLRDSFGLLFHDSKKLLRLCLSQERQSMRRSMSFGKCRRKARRGRRIWMVGGGRWGRWRGGERWKGRRYIPRKGSSVGSSHGGVGMRRRREVYWRAFRRKRCKKWRRKCFRRSGVIQEGGRRCWRQVRRATRRGKRRMIGRHRVKNRRWKGGRRRDGRRGK